MEKCIKWFFVINAKWSNFLYLNFFVIFFIYSLLKLETLNLENPWFIINPSLFKTVSNFSSYFKLSTPLSKFG